MKNLMRWKKSTDLLEDQMMESVMSKKKLDLIYNYMFRKANVDSIESNMSNLFDLRAMSTHAVNGMMMGDQVEQIAVDRSAWNSDFPPIDILETDDYYNVQIETPRNIRTDDVKIAISQYHLSVYGEKNVRDQQANESYLNREIHYGRYIRKINLPIHCNIEKATTTYNKGLIEVKIPKKIDRRELLVRTFGAEDNNLSDENNN